MKGDSYSDYCGSSFHSSIDSLVKLFFLLYQVYCCLYSCSVGGVVDTLIPREWLWSTDAKALFEIFITFRMVKSTACWIGLANKIGVQGIYLVDFERLTILYQEFEACLFVDNSLPIASMNC